MGEAYLSMKLGEASQECRETYAELEYFQITVRKYMYVYLRVINTINSTALFSK